MDDAERQLLEYLADQPRQRGMVCEPSLVAVAERLVFDPRRLLSDVYAGPNGCVLAALTQAGRDALAAIKGAPST